MHDTGCLALLHGDDQRYGTGRKVGGGEGGMIWKNGIAICIISYMKRVTSPGSMHDTGCLGLGRPRGMVWGGRREEGSGWGTHVYLWRIHFDIWQN